MAAWGYAPHSVLPWSLQHGHAIRIMPRPACPLHQCLGSHFAVASPMPKHDDHCRGYLFWREREIKRSLSHVVGSTFLLICGPLCKTWDICVWLLTILTPIQICKRKSSMFVFFQLLTLGRWQGELWRSVY